MGLITQGWMMYAIILPYALTGIVDPAIRSIVSGQVQSNEQGELQGIFTSLTIALLTYMLINWTLKGYTEQGSGAED